MLKNTFRNRAERFAGTEAVADAGHGSEGPDGVGIKRFEIGASLKEKAALFGQARERVLKTVINLAKESGAKLCGKEMPGKLDLVTDGKAGCIFEDLKVGTIGADPDDFRHEAFVVEVGERDLVLADGAFELDGNQISVDGGDGADG